MTRKDLTEVVLIVDRSGSMGNVAKDMEGGMREFVKKQLEDPGQTNITYSRFDDEVEHVIDNVSADKVELDTLTLQPRGCTALLDGIGSTVTRVGHRLAGTPENERPGLVIVVIATDGGENSSKEYNSSQIKQMIEEQEKKYGWQFTFLGANQDSFAVAGNLGIAKGKVSNYNTENTSAVLTSGAGSLVRSLKFASLDGDDLTAVSYSQSVMQELNDTSKDSGSGTNKSTPVA